MNPFISRARALALLLLIPSLHACHGVTRGAVEVRSSQSHRHAHNAAILGLWTLTHRGEPWCELGINPSPSNMKGEVEVHVVRFLGESWSRFEIVGARVEGPDHLILTTVFDGYSEGTTIDLMRIDKGFFEGTVVGLGYDSPYEVKGERLDLDAPPYRPGLPPP